MQYKNVEITNAELQTCADCKMPLGDVFIAALLRSEEDLIRALNEFETYKKYNPYVEDTTIKIRCPACAIRAQGKTPLADAPLMTTKVKAADSDEEE